MKYSRTAALTSITNFEINEHVLCTHNCTWQNLFHGATEEFVCFHSFRNACGEQSSESDVKLEMFYSFDESQSFY